MHWMPVYNLQQLPLSLGNQAFQKHNEHLGSEFLRVAHEMDSPSRNSSGVTPNVAAALPSRPVLEGEFRDSDKSQRDRLRSVHHKPD
jgi:hypothetical protein